MGFFFIGGLLRQVKLEIHWRWLSILVYFLATYLIYTMTKNWSHQVGKPDELFFGYLSPFVVLQAISFFAAVKDLEFNSQILSFVAQHTYWMYLVHMLVMEKFQKVTGLYVHTDTSLNICLITIATFLGAFIVSIPLYWIEKKILRIPLLR